MAGGDLHADRPPVGVGQHEDGVPLPLIADLLGHASTRMLEQHYRHRVRTSFGAHVGPMEELFGEG